MYNRKHKFHDINLFTTQKEHLTKEIHVIFMEVMGIK